MWNNVEVSNVICIKYRRRECKYLFKKLLRLDKSVLPSYNIGFTISKDVVTKDIIIIVIIIIIFIKNEFLK